MAAKLLGRRIGIEEAARVDVARADPLPKRNVPHPTAREGGRGRVRSDVVGRVAVGDPDRERAIAEQRRGERLPWLTESLLGKDPAKAGAVDEEVGVERAVAVQLEAGDVTSLVDVHVDDLAAHVPHTPAHRETTEVRSDQPRLEV